MCEIVLFCEQVMADKGKKRKTVRRGSSAQTQDPEFNSVLFRSIGCEKFHNSIIGNQKFVKEKAITLAPGECDGMRENIITRGWERYVGYPKRASQALVFEFFSNIFPKTDIDGPMAFSESTSYVRGHTVNFDADTINELFGLQAVDILDDFLRNKNNVKRMKENSSRADEIREALCLPGMDWVRNSIGEPQKLLTSSLTPVAKGWASFIVSTILPSPCHTELSFERAILAGCIIRGEPVNLGWIIEKELNEFAEFKRGVPPSYWRYASLIALLCERAGVVAEPDEATIEPAAAINGRWMRSKTVPEHPVQMGEPQQGQKEEQEPAFNIPAFNIDDLVGPSAEDFQSLRERVDNIAAYQRQIIENQEQAKADRENMRAVQDQMRVNIEGLKANQLVLKRAQDRYAAENRHGMRALYRAVAGLSGGQLDSEANIYQGFRALQPPPQ